MSLYKIITLGVHIAETLPSLLEPDNTGVRKQYGNIGKAIRILNGILH